MTGAVKVTNNATSWQLSIFESDLSATQKLICCYLRTHMNDYRDMAWPSVGRIADKCSLGERSVQSNLKKICSSGFLVRTGRSNLGTNVYEISTPDAPTTPAADAPRTKCTPHLDTVTPALDAPELTKELTNSSKGRFIRPTLDQIRTHCEEKKLTFDPETFYSHYASNGWMVGRTPMKNWKSACITWQKREKSHGKAGHSNESGRKLSSAERTRRARTARAADEQRASDLGCLGSN